MDWLADILLCMSPFAFSSKLLTKSSRSFCASSLLKTVISFLVPPEKGLSFLATINDCELFSTVNLAAEGKLYSVPNLSAATFILFFPGVGLDASPDAEATVTLPSVRKLRLLDEVIFVFVG